MGVDPNFRSSGKHFFAVSCSSNMNRSMEAHSFMQKYGFKIESFGSGNYVKLPGPSIDRPNVYEFDTSTYDEIYEDLRSKDLNLYTSNGLLNMLERNRRIKKGPQRFQNSQERFEVIICLEERVYDQVVEFLQTRESQTGEPVHVINFDIQDNHEEAAVGAQIVVNLCRYLEECDDLDNEIDEKLTEFEVTNSDRNLLHTICFY